ncbi:hypothetical protein N7523_010743 [Penicillium sp. IBT 18751x]|nr:hypothetical protein N7523_010743 [Penicillium sp. IBT 18751x]
MEQKFHFINGLSNDEKSKKLVRSHVMKGKNAGKKIHRRSRLESQVTWILPNVAADYSHVRNDLREKYRDADWKYVSPNRLSIDFGISFLTFSLPVAVTPYSLEVINESWCIITKCQIHVAPASIRKRGQ